MGYYIRSGLVTENIATLDLIYDAIQKNKQLSFKCQQPSDMSRMKYQFNRLLRATQILITEADGQFINLRSQTQVREDWDTMSIVVGPKGGNALLKFVEPTQPDENDFLRALPSASGNFFMMEVKTTPHFNPVPFNSQVLRLGWTCVNDDDEHMIHPSEQSPGLTHITAQRTAPVTKPFDALDKFSQPATQPPTDA